MRKPVIIVTLLSLAACAVGPDYAPVQPELPERFLAVDAAANGDPAALWQQFEEPELAALLTAAAENNARIDQARAVLAESRALSGLRIYSLFPTVTVAANSERIRQSSEDPFSFGQAGVAERFRAGFDAVWEIDLFGNLRRSAEAIIRRTEADLAALYAVEVSIAAETAQTYFQWRGAVRREQLLRQNMDNQQASIDILEASLAAGRGTALDVARARALERSIAARLPAARATRAAAIQRLAVLTGQDAGAVRSGLAEPDQMPVMPVIVATGSPTDWLARRPDIHAAERRLAEATSMIGVATTALYPSLNLIGDFGWTTRSVSSIGDADGERWGFAPTLSWRILDYGRVRQEIKASEARAANALAVFDQTWRRAIEETENALANYRAATETVAVLGEAVAQSAAATSIARLRYDNGADSYLSVLDAERSQLDLEDQLALAQTDQATALAALYKAFGGSFSDEP